MLQNIIDEHIAENRKEHTNDITLSQLGKCARMLILKQNNAPHTDFDARTLRVFECGFIFESFVADILQAKNKIVAAQIPCEYMGFKGTADLIVYDEVEKQNVLYDIKSVNSQKFHYLDKGELDEGYAMQVSAYNLALTSEYKLGNIARLCYVSKDDLCLKEVGVTVEKYREKIDCKITLLKKHIVDKTIPDELPQEKEDGKTEWQCFSHTGKNKSKIWCNFIQNCPEICKIYEDKIKRKVEENDNTAAEGTVGNDTKAIIGAVTQGY